MIFSSHYWLIRLILSWMWPKVFGWGFALLNSAFYWQAFICLVFWLSFVFPQVWKIPVVLNPILSLLLILLYFAPHMVQIMNDFSHELWIKCRGQISIVSFLRWLFKILECQFFLLKLQRTFAFSAVCFTGLKSFPHLIWHFSTCWCVFFQLIYWLKILGVQ